MGMMTIEFLTGLGTRVQVFVILRATGLGGSRIFPMLRATCILVLPLSRLRVLTHRRSRRLQVHKEMTWNGGLFLIFDHIVTFSVRNFQSGSEEDPNASERNPRISAVSDDPQIRGSRVSVILDDPQIRGSQVSLILV